MFARFHYSLHKRVVESDCALPFLAPVKGIAAPDLTVCLCSSSPMPSTNTTPWYRSDAVASDDTPAIVIDKADDGGLIIRFADSTAFVVGMDGKSIALLSAPAEYTHDDLAAYLLGPVVAVALHLQGSVLLHASAMVMRGKAVVIAGEAGSGKSTAAAMLHRLGYLFLSDDITEITDENPYAALPAPAAIRLWPDVLDALYGSAAAFPDRAPSWTKKVVRLDESAADDGPHEIGAILFLDRDARGSAARLERLAPRAGWQRLIADAYTARLPDATMSRKIFEVTSALADRVEMFSFHPPPIAECDGLGAFLERELSESLR